MLSEFANSLSFAKVRRFSPSWSEAVETQCDAWRAKKQRETLISPLAPKASIMKENLCYSNRGTIERQSPFQENNQSFDFKSSHPDERKQAERRVDTAPDSRILRLNLPDRSVVQRQLRATSRRTDMQRNETLCHTVRDLEYKLRHSERETLEMRVQLDKYYRENVALQQNQSALRNEIRALSNDLTSRGKLLLEYSQELDYLKQERNDLKSELAKIKAEDQEKYNFQVLKGIVKAHAKNPLVQADEDTVKNPNTRNSAVADLNI
jgi:cell division protein FtsB